MRTEGEITKEEYTQMRNKLDKQIIDLDRIGFRTRYK